MKEPMIVINSAYALDMCLSAETEEEREAWSNVWYELLGKECDEAFYYGQVDDLPKDVTYFDDIDWELEDMKMELAEEDDEKFFEEFDKNFEKDFDLEECYKDCRTKE